MKNFEKLSDEDKIKIEEVFVQMISNMYWGDSTFKIIDRKIPIHNFKNDHFCNDIAFRKITNFIISNYKGNIEETLVSARKYIMDNHILKSEQILTSPTTIGTVIIREYLLCFLLTEYGDLFRIPEDVEEFFAKEPSLFSIEEKKCLLKVFEKIIWITWDEKNSELSPFSFSINRNIEEICDALGLSDLYFSKEYAKLLVIFKGVDSNNIKKPTIADANIDNDLWYPTPDDFIDFGLTKSRSNITLASGYTKNRPEAVIKSANLNLSYLFKKLDNYE